MRFVDDTKNMRKSAIGSMKKSTTNGVAAVVVVLFTMDISVSAAVSFFGKPHIQALPIIPAAESLYGSWQAAVHTNYLMPSSLANLVATRPIRAH